LARAWQTKREFAAVVDHPLIGPRAVDDYAMSELDALRFAGRHEDAVRSCTQNYARHIALVAAGRYHDAVKLPLEASSFESAIYANADAAMFIRDWDALDRARGHLVGRKKNTDKLDLVSLLRKEPEACNAWLVAHAAESRHGIAAAATREAFARCAAEFPDTLAGAEAAFRLGEATWLDDGDKEKAAPFFENAQKALEKLAAASNDVAAYAAYRLGQIAMLVQNKPDSAALHWTRGAKLTGIGAKLCAEAGASITESGKPRTAVGEHTPAPASIVRVDSRPGHSAVHVVLDHPRGAATLQGIVRNPSANSTPLFERYDTQSNPMWDRWSFWLWYSQHLSPPGFYLVHVKTADYAETVWCLIGQHAAQIQTNTVAPGANP